MKKITQFVFVLLVCLGLVANFPLSVLAATPFAAASSTHYASLGSVNNDRGGSDAWSFINKISANDNSYVTANINRRQTSQVLSASDFHFNIPNDAVINGVQVMIGRLTSIAGIVRDDSVYLTKGGEIVGDNYQKTISWPTNESAVVYGGAEDLWGTTWTPAEINSADFGVELTVKNSDGNRKITAYVDYISVIVSYTTKSSGLLDAQSAENLSGISSLEWSNLAGITADDDDNAFFDLNTRGNVTATTNYLYAKDYGFDVPENATITGIQVLINRSASISNTTSNVKDNVVSLVKNGSLVGNNYKNLNNWSKMTSDVITYGGPEDLWGTTWTPAEINSDDFGLALSATLKKTSSTTTMASVDAIKIIVTYSLENDLITAEE